MIFVPAILLLDGPGLGRQLALGLATAVFLFLLVRETGVDARQVVCAVLVATLGEIILSVGWELYSYRFATIPFYVPPGHGVFYTLAAAFSARDALRRHERAIVVGMLAFGSIVSLVSFVVLRDQWGLLWWIVAATLIARSRNALLLSVCCALTMSLEWLGTALGNWRWAAEVPGLGLSSANPPGGVGILYVLLDLITVSICARIVTMPSRRMDDRLPTAESASQLTA